MADLKRICGVDDEDLADMVRELRAYDPKPGCRFARERPSRRQPDVLRPPRRATAMRSSSTARPCRGAGQPPLLPGAEERAAGQGVEAWLSECLASANWLVKALDQRARTIVKVVSEIVKRQQGFFEHGRRAIEAADPARGRRSDRDARIDRQPGHLEQISAVRARPVRAQIFLRLGRRLGRRRRAALRPKRSRRRSDG